MTYRERKQRRMERRAEWAKSRDRQASLAFETTRSILDPIPLGQPVLIGHHSQKRHQRALERADNAMRRGVESEKMAQHHRSVAAGIQHQLDTSIYRDDPDAIEQLEARIAERRAQLERRKAINAVIRKQLRTHGTTKGWSELVQPPLTDDEKGDLERAARFSQCIGYPPYAISNLSADVRRNEQRLEKLRKVAEQRARVAEVLEAERAAESEAAYVDAGADQEPQS